MFTVTGGEKHEGGGATFWFGARASAGAGARASVWRNLSLVAARTCGARHNRLPFAMSAIKDISSLAGAAQMNAAIKKEMHFSAIFAKRDAARNAAAGSPFRINPKAIRPVAAPIGAADKRRHSPDYATRKAADLEALKATLQESLRAPQEKSVLPRTTAGEYGWHWREPEAPIISKRPLAPTWQKRCGEVEYAEVRGGSPRARAPPQPHPLANPPHATRTPQNHNLSPTPSFCAVVRQRVFGGPV